MHFRNFPYRILWLKSLPHDSVIFTPSEKQSKPSKNRSFMPQALSFGCDGILNKKKCEIAVHYRSEKWIHQGNILEKMTEMTYGQAWE